MSTKTISLYRWFLGKFFEFVEQRTTLELVDRDLIREWILSLKKLDWSEHSINDSLRILKVFWNWMIAEGFWLGESPLEKIKPLMVERRLKRILSPDEMNNLLQVPNCSTFTGLRNYCLLLIMYEAMLRLNEALTLKSVDVDWTSGSVVVFGKGRKERVIDCLGTKAVASLRQLWAFRQNLSGKTFFCQQDGKPLKVRYVQHLVTRYGKRIGLRVYPHLLRHTGATHRVQLGENLYRVKQLLGHSSITTTEHYV
ncbi:MAG: tyrosine-type recombinase/integrase, partial [Limisphaerales bacterium]